MLMVLHLLQWTTGLQNSRHFVIQSEVKQKPVVATSHSFSRALRQLHENRVLIGSLYCLCPL